LLKSAPPVVHTRRRIFMQRIAQQQKKATDVPVCLISPSPPGSRLALCQHTPHHSDRPHTDPSGAL
jgi:hypothetical protein